MEMVDKGILVRTRHNRLAFTGVPDKSAITDHVTPDHDQLPNSNDINILQKEGDTIRR